MPQSDRRAARSAGKMLTTACAIGLLATVSACQAAPRPAASTTAARRPPPPATAGPPAATPPACPVAGSPVQPLYLDTGYSFAERAADLVEAMQGGG